MNAGRNTYDLYHTCILSCDVKMSAMASQITSMSIVYSTVCSGADQRKYPCSASLAFVMGIHRAPANSRVSDAENIFI